LPAASVQVFVDRTLMGLQAKPGPSLIFESTHHDPTFGPDLEKRTARPSNRKSKGLITGQPPTVRLRIP
jgi:hypothetical protein